MIGMKAAPIPIRLAVATLFALLLGLRSLAPAGFMPAFDRGSLTIVACPDADAPVASMAHHRHPADHKLQHEPCPYAAASALGALSSDLAPMLATLLFGALLVVGRPFLLDEPQSRRERPPSRAPPIPA
jgi:hypothetical protein